MGDVVLSCLHCELGIFAALSIDRGRGIHNLADPLIFLFARGPIYSFACPTVFPRT